MCHIVKLLVSAFAILATSAAAQAGKIEDVRFPTNVVPGRSNDNAVELKARLHLPDDPLYPVPAVVITPSSGGIRRAREIYYADELAKAGIAALLVDSFGSRGVESSVYDQRLLTRWQVGNDAVAGLRWLSRDDRFRADRIGVMGVSKGGIAALDTALQVRRRWMRMGHLAFAAHVPIVPGCQWINRSTATTEAPILFMLAELDDTTPAASCQAYAERLKEGGNPRIEVKLYKGAQHAWEATTPKPFFNPWAENYSQCRVWVEDDGSLIAAKTGETIPRQQWHAWAKRSCVKLGATCCGGTPELKRQATSDLIAFLKKHGF